MSKKTHGITRSSGALILCLSLATGVGCVASKDEVRSIQSDLQNSVGTARKELKAEIDAVKKQAQDDTQKLKADIDAKAIKALTEQKEKIDTMSTEMKTQDEAATKEIQQLKQQVQADQAALKVVQDQLLEVQKTNLQVLREFQAVRNGVQVTYGGVLDYLKVEEALLKSSLHRVQSILHGVNQEPGTLPALIDPKQRAMPAAPASPPALLEVPSSPKPAP